MAMSEPASGVVEDVVCPFCGLGCDDLSVETDGGAIRARAPACPGAVKLFAREDAAPPGPRIGGKEVSLEEAAGEAHALLTSAMTSLFTGLGADIAGLGAVMDLACAHGGVLDHYRSDGLFRNLDVQQRAGWIATTLAETRNRCDLMLVVGPDPSADFDRLWPRLLPAEPLFVAGRRRIVFLGVGPSDASRQALAGADVEVLDLPLASSLSRLRGLVEGRAAAGAGEELAVLGERLKSARYAVVVWDAALLPDADGDRVVAAAGGLVDALNETTRAAVLPLGGADNLIGANQIMLWRLGLPLRSAIRGGRSVHDASLHSAARAGKDADLMVWVSAFRPAPPPEFDGKLVALAHPDTVFSKEPEVFIPVGTPGIDHAGHVFRLDTVVCLPLDRLRISTLPSVTETARAIGRAAS